MPTGVSAQGGGVEQDTTCVSINPNEPRQLALDQLSIGSFNAPYNARNLKEDRGKCAHPKKCIHLPHSIDTTIDQIDHLLKKASQLNRQQ